MKLNIVILTFLLKKLISSTYSNYIVQLILTLLENSPKKHQIETKKLHQVSYSAYWILRTVSIFFLIGFKSIYLVLKILLLIFDLFIISTAYLSMNKVNTIPKDSLFNYIRYRRNPSKDFSIKTTTSFITISKSSLKAHFDIDNNVVILQEPAIIHNNLVFKNEPLFKGRKIRLYQQLVSKFSSKLK